MGVETERTYFKHEGDELVLSSEIRRAVDFRYLNLAEDAYPALSSGVWGIDVILCRNVMIYFSVDVIARVAQRLIDSLSDEGWLLLGASDPTLSDYVRCEVVTTCQLAPSNCVASSSQTPKVPVAA